MKIKILIFTLLLWSAGAFAQTGGPKLPVKVPNVELTDLDKKPTKIPYYGQKHMMIFYVDPDAHKQNQKFTEDLETNGKADSPNIQGYAILNLKDTALPNGIVRNMADKRTKGKPSINLADAGHILRDAWKLGDVNNKFCLLFVTKEGELVFFRCGDFSDKDIQDFYALLDKYR